MRYDLIFPTTKGILRKLGGDKIDPKYLPGVCLPVVELSEETATALFNTGNAVCTVKEAAVFRAAKEALLPVVVATNLNGMIMSSVALLTTDLGGEDVYRYKMDSGFGYLYFILGADEVSGQLKNE